MSRPGWSPGGPAKERGAPGQESAPQNRTTTTNLAPAADGPQLRLVAGASTSAAARPAEPPPTPVDLALAKLFELPPSKRPQRHIVWVRFENAPVLAVSRQMKGQPRRTYALCAHFSRKLKAYHLHEIRSPPQLIFIPAASVLPATPDVGAGDLCPRCAGLYSLAKLGHIDRGLR